MFSTRRVLTPLEADSVFPCIGSHIHNTGVFNLRTGQVEPFSPDHLYTIAIPHNYNPKAKCPKFDQFMAQILPLTDHPVVAKILGYLLIPSAEFHGRGSAPSQGSGCEVRLSVKRHQIPWLRVFVEGVVIVGKLEN